MAKRGRVWDAHVTGNLGVQPKDAWRKMLVFSVDGSATDAVVGYIVSIGKMRQVEEITKWKESGHLSFGMVRRFVEHGRIMLSNGS